MLKKSHSKMLQNGGCCEGLQGNGQGGAYYEDMQAWLKEATIVVIGGASSWESIPQCNSLSMSPSTLVHLRCEGVKTGRTKEYSLPECLP